MATITELGKILKLYLTSLGIRGHLSFKSKKMISRELKAASSKPMILSILSHGESYGYQIIQNIEKLSGGKWEWSEAMLYPVLHRMNADGLIQSEWKVMENGRKRKYYSLTPLGKESLAEEKNQWMSVHKALKALWGDNPNLVLE